MFIEINGVGFVNKGAELMLHAILQMVSQKIPHAKFVLKPWASSPYEKRAKLGLYQKIWFSKFRMPFGMYCGKYIPKRLREYYGLVCHEEINVVLDSSGFAFGDQWGPGNTIAMAKALRRGKRLGTKVIFLPQAFGPFSTRQIRKAFHVVATQADRIYARDSVSYKHIVDLVGELPNLRRAPDFTVLLKGRIPSYIDGASHDVAIIPNRRMVDRTSISVAEHYIPFLMTCVQHFLYSGYKPFFLVHEGREDEELAREAVRPFGSDVPIVTEEDPLNMKGIIGTCKSVVSSRYHGLISALSQGVPSIGTGWSHKYRELFYEYGCPNLLLAPDTDEEQILSVLTSFTRDREELKKKLAKPATQHKQATIEMWNDVLHIICGDD